MFWSRFLDKNAFQLLQPVVSGVGFMNKLFAVLTITIVVLSFVSGFLFYQINDVQGLNSELRSKSAEVQNQLDEQQEQNNELENQITELQNQNSGLQNQITEQQDENSELQEQLDEQQTRNDELQNQTNDLQLQISEIQNQLNASQNQISILQNQVSEQLDALREATYELARERPLKALISKFEWDWSFDPFGGLTVVYTANVTVSNIDVTALGGLTLNVKLLKKGTLIEPYGSSGFTTQIGILQAKESRVIPSKIFATVGTISRDSAVCSITLTAGDIVVDERIYNLPEF